MLPGKPRLLEFLLLSQGLHLKTHYCNCSSDQVFGKLLQGVLQLTLSSLEGSGCANNSLQRVMRGDHIGTLFHKDAHLWVDMKETGARDMAVAARDGSRRLQVCSTSIETIQFSNMAHVYQCLETELEQLGQCFT